MRDAAFKLFGKGIRKPIGQNSDLRARRGEQAYFTAGLFPAAKYGNQRVVHVKKGWELAHLLISFYEFT